MSIHDTPRSLITQGRLIERPSSFLEISAREMVVTPEIDALTRQPFSDTAEGERFAAFAADLNAFSELNDITISENPLVKPPDVMLARVAPVEADYWSIRVIEPEGTAGLRSLGAFVCKDVFVALTWDFREDISDFAAEVADVQDVWRDYFGELTPFSGSSLDEYLTNYTPV